MSQVSREASPPKNSGLSDDEGLFKSLVTDLRSREKGITRTIAPLLEKRDRELERLAKDSAVWLPLRLTLAWYDDLIFSSLANRYDTLDRAVMDGHIPFVEVGRDGYIKYANEAFRKLAENAVGRPFAELFGPRKANIEEALNTERNSLRAELHENGQIRQFRVEIGPLQDESGENGAYAFLLDLSAEEARWEASLEGILRISSTGFITFANAAAAKLVGRNPEELLGQSAEGLFYDPISRQTNLIEGWLQSETANIQEVLLSDCLTPARMSVLPFFDDPERQSGILLTFHSIVEELARKQLQHLLASDMPPLELVKQVMQVVKAVVPYDLATFGIYTSDESHFRTILVDPIPDFSWSTRWFPVSPKALEWVREGMTWDNDLKALVGELMPDDASNPVVHSILNLGMRCSLSLPILGPSGKYIAALSVLSKDHQYFKTELEKLRELDLESILLAAVAGWEKKRDEGIRELKLDLIAAPSAKLVAKKLVEGVSRCFDWEYVGVFRIDRGKERFVLYAQHDSTGGSLALKEDFTQSLDEGMFHHVLVEGATLVVADTRREKPDYDFIANNEAQASAMATPLRVDGRAELLLALLSTKTNAFQGDDRLDLEDLVANCEQIIENRWQSVFTASLLNTSEQAAVVVDAAGTICKTNGRAEMMLGFTVGRKLSEYGADENEKKSLTAAQEYYQHPLMLAPDGGGAIPTLATQRFLDDDFGHRLWLFTDLRDRQWQFDWRYLDATVREVAQQTRTPLLIADGLLRQAAGLIHSPRKAVTCAGLLEKAANQLGKADLTFERLSDTFMARRKPTDAAQTFDALESLRGSIQMLPSEDATRISVYDNVDKPFLVKGWPDRLEFVFRSLLGNLLLNGSGETEVRIHATHGRAGELRLQLDSILANPSLSSMPPNVQHPIAVATDRARQSAQLAPEAVKAVIRQHNGQLLLSRSDAKSFEVVIILPPSS